MAPKRRPRKFKLHRGRRKLAAFALRMAAVDQEREGDAFRAEHGFQLQVLEHVEPDEPNPLVVA